MTDAAVTLVDSNVLFDILGTSLEWGSWSTAALSEAHATSDLAINPLIFAEVCAGMTSFEDADAALSASIFRREALPWEAAFLAGRAFTKYRRRGGSRRSPLPDFYIGAHAAVRGYRLLIRDGVRYRTYFPTVALITP